MIAEPLPRVTEQIIRNNIARTLAANLDIAPNLAWGVDEYFQMWGDGAFPWVDGVTLTLHPNTALNAAEREALMPLVAALNTAWAETEGMAAEQFLDSPWSLQISKLAQAAFSVMSKRGCFSEQAEEAEPSEAF